MRAVQRLAGGDPGILADAGVGIVAVGLTVVAVWGLPGLILTAVGGPRWLRVLLPLGLGAALVLRRRQPLLMWTAIWAGLALQSRLTVIVPQSLGFTFVLLTAAYSLGAHTRLRNAVAGLVVAAPFAAEISQKGRLGLVLTEHGGKEAVALSFLQLLAFWLAGVLARARAVVLQRQAEQAAAAERARIARELHDIVAHHLSVIVLQAAGARASGKPAGATLEKIENSARSALADTRRLLGVLRDPGDGVEFSPQPGIGELDALAARVRSAGLPVNLVIDDDLTELPAAVDVSVYRIVQEALTNVLKHAGPARAEVTIAGAPDTSRSRSPTTESGNPASRPRPADTGSPECASEPRYSAVSWPLARGPAAGSPCGPLAQARLLDPDVILMDIRMPGMNGIEATTRLASAGARARVLMLTTFNLDEYVYYALKAGASGFLLKDASREQLAGAVRAASAGETLLAPAITRRLIEDYCSGPAPGTTAGGLSERELGVVRLVAQGLSNAEIAARLYLSEATVKSHIARILAKLGLRDRVQVAVHAYEHGIVRPGRGTP